MIRIRKTGVAAVAVLAVAMAGCLDMDTVNTNNPDAERALSSPGDVETLLGGSYVGVWEFKQQMEPNMMLSLAAEEQTSGWGNWCFNCLAGFPRNGLNNNLGTGGYHGRAWDDLYGPLSSVNDALRQQADGMDFGENGADNARALAFGRFVQGLVLSYQGVLFDRGLIIDETVNIEEEVPQFSPDTEVFAAGLAFLDESISLSRSNTFTLPEPWINGITVTNEDLAKIASSYAARLLSSMPRYWEERQAVDWNRVLDYIEGGITEDYAPIGDANDWFDGLKYYGYSQIWLRTHYNIIGPSDTTGAYAEWYEVGLTNVTDRLEFVLHGKDKRVNGETFGSPGTDFYHYGQNNFPTGTTYRGSEYLPKRYNHIDGLGPMVAMSVTEMDLLAAEAYYHLGQPQMTADLINKTRVARGGLEPVTADDPDLFAKLMYEKRLETYVINGTLAYTDARGWGYLWLGTQLEFPVPGAELELLGYTEEDVNEFGGNTDGTESSAPARRILPVAY